MQSGLAMPCDIRMKRTFLQGLLWLYLFGFGFMALSLEPGYLDFDNLPDTNFSCVGKVIGGYYADLETNCQMFHVCTIGQLDEPMDIRFLCLNGTVFDQETRVCERIDEVDCSKSEQFYSLNLELYGNTQPATLEESPETEQPLIIKSTAPTTTTSTTSTTTTPPTSRTQPFYTTATTPRATSPSPQVISTHHFPVVNSPDIRFDPEEINISLRPGAPPDIRTKPAFEHGFSDGADNKKVVVTTHGDSNSDNKRIVVTTATPAFGEGGASQQQQQQQQQRQQQQQGGFIERPQVQAQQAPQKTFNRPTPGDINFGFTFHQTEPGDDYRTDDPQQPYHFHSDYRPSQEFSGHQHHRHNPLGHQFKSSTFQDDYSSTTSKVNNNNFQQKAPTTPGNFFLQSLAPPAPNQHHHYSQHASRTDKPQRLQLPLPLLPTLPPLTFSSPAPFALQRHIETKRYTKDHQAPPRIIISASASVSDASGRRLNYSLGSFDAGEILEEPPSSYDEYKESDISLDPFYHDVPKVKHSRRRRAVEDRPKPLNIIKNEREAETVLKFLVEWYEEKTIKTDPTINKLIKDSRIKRQAPSKIRHSDIIRNEQEAIDVLRFLLEWYKDHERSSTVPTISTDVRGEVTSTTKRNRYQVDSVTQSNIDEEYVNFANSDLFNKNSKFSIIGNHAPSTGKRTNDVSRNPDEDYVNDNFEPIAYNEKYGKTDNRKLKLKHEEIKNKSLPTDYVDDNVEPIYYRDRGASGASKQDSVADNTEESSNVNSKILDQLYHDIKELNDALLDTKTGESKEKVSVRNGDTKTNNINNISGYINHDIKELNDALLSPAEVEKVEEKPLAKSVYIKIDHLNNKVTAKINHASKELNDALLPAHIDENPLDQRYDPETNNINKRVEDDRPPLRSTFITPRFEVTTSSAEKTTAASTSVNRTSRRRGRGRQHNAVTNSSTTKSKQNKNVVIEKITEKAHTAKDDFNYLRTLYKVLSTTPMYNISEEANPYVKLKKVTSSQQDRDLFSQNFDFGDTGYGEDKTQSESQNVPIVTTEEAVTSTTSRVGRRRGRTKTQTTKAIHHGRRRTTQPTQQSATDTAVTSEQTSPNERDSITRSEEAATQTLNGSGGLLGERNIQTSTTAYGLVPRSEIAEPTTTVSPIPTVTPLTDDVETQTSFFNELTHNYKRLFEVLTSSQPSTTLANSKRGYVTSHNPTTQSLDTLLKRTLSVSATTDLPKQQRTTISPADATYASILPPTTELPNVETESVGPSHDETTELSTLPVTTATTQKEISTTEGTSVVQTPATIPTTLSELYKVVNIETVGKIVLQPIKDVVPNEKPHVKSYRRANRKETESTTQQLESATTKTHYVKADNDATTVADPMQIKLYRRFNKKDTDFTTKQYIGTSTILTPEVDTTVSYPKVSYYGKVNKEEPEYTTKLEFETTANPHFPFDFTIYPTSSSHRRTTTEEIFETTTTENIPTTRGTFVRFRTTDIDDDDDEELAESNKAVGGKPKEHVLQENRHFLSSFTQSFSYTEEMDKDTPTIQETEILTREVQEGVPIPTTIPEETTSTIDLTTDPILETETYPSILVVTTTRTTTTTTTAPTTTESHNKLEGTTYIPMTKMTTEKMIRFIKEVEATTKSVAVSTEVPPTTTAATTERTETTTDTVISTTEQTETLQELVHEIEDMTKSKIGTTTYEVMPRRRGRPKTTESTTTSQLSTTQEAITWPSTTRHEELVTQKSETTSTDDNLVNRLSSTVQTPSDTTTENSITTPQATTLEEKATTEAPVTEEPTATTVEETISTTELPTTTEGTTTTTTAAPVVQRGRGVVRRGGRRGIRPAVQRNLGRNISRHRFSPETSTKGPEERKQTIEEEIIDEIAKNSPATTTEALRPARRRQRKRKRIHVVEEASTDAPLQKSASPTRAERRQSLPTTPLSSDKFYIFNCFGKTIDKFYPDPRDCRLFHYCTQGYNKYQLLDMKFVCDQNTYFDDEKLICTKQKPGRCL